MSDNATPPAADLHGGLRKMNVDIPGNLDECSQFLVAQLQTQIIVAQYGTFKYKGKNPDVKKNTYNLFHYQLVEIKALNRVSMPCNLSSRTVVTY